MPRSRFIARSPVALALIPIEDMLGLDEQPNLPGTIDEHPNWRRRLMRPPRRVLDDPAGARAPRGPARARQMTPRATMRLQFHKGFTFADAARHVPYLARLGISHVYASPITTARPGSMHGYDVIDPTRVNPELGGEDGLAPRWSRRCARAGLGLIVDIVPNHMAVGRGERLVARCAQARSRRAGTRAISTSTGTPRTKRCAARCCCRSSGKPYGEALAAGEITLDREPDGFVARYFQQRFPIAGRRCARSSIDAAFDPKSARPQAADALLSRQHYRLAWWRIANDEINWRRFFDINELAGLRMEHAAAFEEAHALVFRLYAEGLIDGVRIDHIDGLSDPAGYCRLLRRRLDALAQQRPTAAPRDRPISWWRKSCCAARRWPPTGPATAPAAMTS